MTTTYGTRPVGATTTDAARAQRWATVTTDDGTVTVTAYSGWGITDEVTLTGPTATAPDLIDYIARSLLGRRKP